MINPFNVAGRQARGRSIREQDELPYAYDSNMRQLRIIKIVLVLWVILALATAFADYQERQVLAKWDNAGFQQTPSDNTIDGLLRYATDQGVDCNTNATTGVLPRECERVFELAGELDEAETRVFILFAGYMFLFIALAILISSFAYQANRNLLTLKSEGQHFSAVSAMLWLFVPMFNFYKGGRIFQEIWKGSDPDVERAGEKWKNSSPSGMVTLWWVAFAVTILLGPRTIRWFWGSDFVDDRLSLGWGLVAMDLFLAAPAIFAYIAMSRIHERQEKKHEIVGHHMAVPPIKGLSLDR